MTTLLIFGPQRLVEVSGREKEYQLINVKRRVIQLQHCFAVPAVVLDEKLKKTKKKRKKSDAPKIDRDE